MREMRLQQVIEQKFKKNLTHGNQLMTAGQAMA